MTGDVSDAHEYVDSLCVPLFNIEANYVSSPSVISITSYSAILSSPDAQRDQLRASRPKGGSSWLVFLFKLFGWVGAIAAVLYAYKIYMLRGLKGFGITKSTPGLGAGLYADSKRF